MEGKMKEVVVYIRKYFLFSLKFTYKFSCRHPFVASFTFFLFMLYSCYPSLFAFLVSSFPVISCTALLLGILLSYGEPNIPEIEEDDKINREVSSLKEEDSVDNLFVKKDENITLEGLVDSRVGSEERISNDSDSYGEREREIDLLAIDLMKKQSESYMRTTEVADGVSEGIEGLMVKIKKPELDDWLDSSLGSPWQPVNIRDPSSDSESDRAESSSPDASITDILPMLDELSPLLDSETPHNVSKSADNSDSELSQHHESDEDSVKEDEYKNEEKDESNKVVTWTADDHKNVMDLGSSDLERNRRLESLIARRRARKNQIIIYEKDLIDLHSNDMTMDDLFHFQPQIPPIFAPRRNPFDIPHELDESKGLPPIPGSAPSVMHRRQNPFDFQFDGEAGNKGHAEENLHQSEFRMPFQRGLSFRRHESFALHSAFPCNLTHKKHGSSRLNPYVVAEGMDSETNDYVDFHSQLSEKSETKSSSAPTAGTVSSAIDQDDQKVPIEQETQESIALSVPVHRTKPTEKCSHTYEDDLVYSQPELGEDGHSVDPIASAVTEEAYDASDIVKKNIEYMQFGENHEVLEGKHDDLTLFSSSESIEKSLDISLDEVLETHEQITRVSKASGESMQSSDASASHLIYEPCRVDINQAAVPIYDSSPSGSGNFLANISVPDDNLLYSGREDIHSISTVESHVQEDAVESMTTGMIEFNVVHESKLQDSRSDTGETVTFSSYMNLLDENILASMGISETREQDFNVNSSPRISEGFGDLATSLKIDHSSSLSSAEADYEPRLAFSAGFPPSEVMEKHQSMEKFEMQASFGTYLEQSLVSNLELGPILEENSEDLKVEEDHMSLVQTNTTSASTGLHILEGSDVTLSSVGQEVVPLYNHSKEEAQDLGNEVIPSKTSNLVSANEDMLTGIAIGELVDSMDSLNQSMIKSEPEFTSNDDISDSQDDVIDEFQINQDVILSNLNDFYSEHGEMDDDVREIQVIDEHLLSELDAVGDFQVEELKCQECLLIESQSDGQFICSEDDSELRSAHVAETSPDKTISANFIHPDEMDFVLNSEEPRDSGYLSLEMAPVEDLTVYNPKHRVLEASSVEELDSIFKQDRPRELAEPPLSESMVDKLVAEKPYLGSRSFDIVDQEIEAILQEAVLITLTGKNAEDISSVLLEDGREFDVSASPHERQKYDHVESVIPSTSGLTSYASAIAEAEASSHELDTSGRDFQIKETNSVLLVLEAKSIEDIRSAFQDVTEVVVNKSISPLIKPEPHPVDTVVEAMSHDVDKTSGLLVVQAKSAEDINSALKKVTEEGFSDHEKMTNRLYYEVMEPSSPDTENSSDLFVLEARSAEDIRLAFKQTTAESSAMPTPLIYSESSKTSQEHEVVEAMHLEAQYNIELPVPEEKSSEDIDSALDHDVDHDMPTSQVYPVSSANRNDGEIVDVKLLETQINQELLVLDAKYVEDIDSSFKPSSESGLLRSTSLETHPDHDAVKDGSLKATINSELLVLEAESVEETSSTLMHATGRVFDKSSPLGYPEASGTSEVLNEISLGLENGSDMLSPETKSFLYLNSDCKQNIEAKIVQSNLPEFGKFQPDHEAIEERSLDAINRLELFNLESKSFEVTHSTFKEAAVDFIGQSTTALVDPGHNPGQEVLDVKSPDTSNISDFPVLEEKYLEKLNLTFGQAMEGFLPKPASEVGAEHDSVGESCLAADEYSELVVLEEKSIENIQSPFSDANAGVHEGSSSLPVDPEPKENLPGHEVEDNMCFEAENNSEMSDEAKSVEDINSAFKQATNVASSPLFVESRSLGIGGPLSSLVLEAKSIELTDSSSKKAHQEDSNNSDFFTDPPPLQTNSDKDSELLVLEKSVEDIDSTLTPVTERYLDSPFALQDDSKQTETIHEPTDNNVVAKQDSEVEYAEETIVASDEEVTGENSSSEDQINRRKDGEEAGSDDPSSIAPPSMKIKKKFEKSDSSSSSSSSSSD
ncbi:hypothetical protein IEQ34_019456 [Dendrobium chrysotoxum]|uniref:Uncharacterized protein n=1 Tax=Dendrobium chrysotoxum TaxID=161865 RepID=A0AAV7G7G1_DENCH|nr:hypothetical protein IEQ34_019456 [Dendrobium chrysotoxum]